MDTFYINVAVAVALFVFGVYEILKRAKTNKVPLSKIKDIEQKRAQFDAIQLPKSFYVKTVVVFIVVIVAVLIISLYVATKITP